MPRLPLRGRKAFHPDFDALMSKLQQQGFSLLGAGEGRRMFISKHGCAAGLEPDAEQGARYFAPPGRVVKGELARLIDRGYQKFLKTADSEVPATAQDLRAIYDFNRELHYAAGSPLLYNESLGTVSNRYLYDRVWFRDEGRQPKVWEKVAPHS